MHKGLWSGWLEPLCQTLMVLELTNYEARYHMASEEFFDKFSRGQSEDAEDLVEWSNDYQHYRAIRCEIEGYLKHVA